MLDDIMRALRNLAVKILNLLPDSPFTLIEKDDDIVRVLGYVNYFIPINFFISCMVPWLSAVGIYYAYQLILRWGKAIE